MRAICPRCETFYVVSNDNRTWYCGCSIMPNLLKSHLVDEHCATMLNSPLQATECKVLHEDL